MTFVTKIFVIIVHLFSFTNLNFHHSNWETICSREAAPFFKAMGKSRNCSEDNKNSFTLEKLALKYTCSIKNPKKQNPTKKKNLFKTDNY